MSLFDQINTKDFGGDAATGEKHLPIISTEKTADGKVKVKVVLGGEGKHPNDIDHWFQWVELKINDLFVARSEFSAGITEPISEFTLNLGKACKISAVARCNKHGLWQTDVDYKG